MKSWKSWNWFDHSAIFRKVNKRLEINQKINVHGVSLCEKCGDTFEDHESFNRHIQSCLGEAQQSLQNILKCKDCDFISVKKCDLDIHMTQNHKEIEIECDQCGIYFVTVEELDFHRATCIQDIVSINHTLQGLLDEKKQSFNCNSCDESFDSKKSLRRHSQKHHKLFKVKDDVSAKNIPKHFKNRKLECGMCEMDFNSVEYMDG